MPRRTTHHIRALDARLDAVFLHAHAVAFAKGARVQDAFERLGEVERVVFFTHLLDSQLRRNGAALWITNGYTWANAPARAALAALDDAATRPARAALDAIEAVTPRVLELERDWENEALEDEVEEACMAIDVAYLRQRGALDEALYAFLEAHPDETP